MTNVWRNFLVRRNFLKSAEERRRIHAQIVVSSTARASFYFLVVLSTTIAAFGLLANSTAVVIGAMLVAPLMGPIFGIALALASGSHRMLARATAAEVTGVLLCLTLAVFIGTVTMYPSFGTEILARTKPTLYDIFIAFASGLAGAYSLVDERISPALPGVAIATALVPPITTSGLCISAGQWDWAFGAFLLFFANFLSIELAAALVFMLAGLGKAGSSEKKTIAPLLKRFGLSFALLAIVAVYMTRTLIGMVAESRFSEEIRAVLATEVLTSVGASLADFKYHKENDKMEVVAVVLTPQEFLPEQVLRIEESLRRKVDPHITLVIRSLLSKDADCKGPVFLTPEDEKRRAVVKEQTDFLSRVTQILTKGLSDLPATRLVDLRQEVVGGQIQVTAVVRTPAAIEPEGVERLQTSLRTAIGEPLRLTIRSVLARDADADQFLYGGAEQPPLTEKEREFALRVKERIVSELAEVAPGAKLTELRTFQKGERPLVMAGVFTRSLIVPKVVSRLEKKLRSSIDPKIDLVVQSTIGSTASSEGYLAEFNEQIFKK